LAKKYEDIIWTEDSEYHAFLRNHYPTLVQHFATKQTKSNAKKSRTAPQSTHYGDTVNLSQIRKEDDEMLAEENRNLHEL
jgi:hypothetical protein